MDLMARTLARACPRFLKTGGVIITRAAGTLGTALTCKRKSADILTLYQSPILFSPHIQKLEYNPLKDITYIAGLLTQPYAIVVQADSWKTFRAIR
jgi:tripartite-type tricarboxylate transporter receptor subunit TctC